MGPAVKFLDFLQEKTLIQVRYRFVIYVIIILFYSPRNSYIYIITYTENEDVISDNTADSNVPISTCAAFKKKRRLDECKVDKRQKDEKPESSTAKEEPGKHIFLYYY